MAYINALVEDAQESKPSGAVCFLCEAIESITKGADADAATERLVLLQDERGLMILNRYPYTNGHLLVAPNAHVASLSDMTPSARANLMELTELAQRLLERSMNPQGINIGINSGRCAGAGLPGHLHVHLVPRWSGDTNFMQTIGGVRVIPQSLEASYAMLKDALQALTSAE